jgi:hypothetical protein
MWVAVSSKYRFLFHTNFASGQSMAEEVSGFQKAAWGMAIRISAENEYKMYCTFESATAYQKLNAKHSGSTFLTAWPQGRANYR